MVLHCAMRQLACSRSALLAIALPLALMRCTAVQCDSFVAKLVTCLIGGCHQITYRKRALLILGRAGLQKRETEKMAGRKAHQKEIGRKTTRAQKGIHILVIQSGMVQVIQRRVIDLCVHEMKIRCDKAPW